MASRPPRKRSRGEPTGPNEQKPPAQLPDGYAELLEDIKARIRAAQVKAALAANRELIRLYWDIGQQIVQRQREQGWGRSVVQSLSHDLQAEFPGMAGFSHSL